ncbi:MAG: hypothetical protein ACREJ2_15875 [Planctomycetota bacterium]
MAEQRYSWTRRWRDSLRWSVARYPSLYLPYVDYRWRHDRQACRVVTRAAQIVIDAFPRSGNTFATMAFQMSQPQPVQIAHHIHAPAQIIRGIQLRLPTLCIIRDPVDAVLSLLIKVERYLPQDAFSFYCKFYTPLLPLHDRFVMATFEQVTSDFGAVIGRVNAKFGTKFAEFQHTPENVQRCFALVEQANFHELGTTRVDEKHVARPSAERDRAKAELKARLQGDEVAHARSQAYSVYERFKQSVGAAGGGA